MAAGEPPGDLSAMRNPECIEQLRATIASGEDVEIFVTPAAKDAAADAARESRFKGLMDGFQHGSHGGFGSSVDFGSIGTSDYTYNSSFPTIGDSKMSSSFPTFGDKYGVFGRN